MELDVDLGNFLGQLDGAWPVADPQKLRFYRQRARVLHATCRSRAGDARDSVPSASFGQRGLRDAGGGRLLTSRSLRVRFIMLTIV